MNNTNLTNPEKSNLSVEEISDTINREHSKSIRVITDNIDVIDKEKAIELISNMSNIGIGILLTTAKITDDALETLDIAGIHIYSELEYDSINECIDIARKILNRDVAEDAKK